MTIKINRQEDVGQFFKPTVDFLVDDQFIDFFFDANAPHAEGQFNLLKFMIRKSPPTRSTKRAAKGEIADRGLHQKLPANHVFNSHEFCGILASILKTQWNGKQGPLLVNGRENFFYVRTKCQEKVCLVSVQWYKRNKGWRVNIKETDGQQLLSGGCIFSTALDA